MRRRIPLVWLYVDAPILLPRISICIGIFGMSQSIHLITDLYNIYATTIRLKYISEGKHFCSIHQRICLILCISESIHIDKLIEIDVSMNRSKLFYRFTDTWIRIDSPMHQYGCIASLNRPNQRLIYRLINYCIDFYVWFGIFNEPIHRFIKKCCTVLLKCISEGKNCCRNRCISEFVRIDASVNGSVSLYR